MAESTKHRLIILRSTADYEAWKHQIKASASKYDLWKYIDPDFDVHTSNSTPPKLIEPKYPTPGDQLSGEEAVQRLARIDAARQQSIDVQLPEGYTDPLVAPKYIKLSHLDEDERATLAQQTQEYLRSIKQFDLRVTAMQSMQSVILESIDVAYLPLTYDCNTALEMMVAMKKQFKPTDHVAKMMILEEWNRATESPDRSTDIDKWLVKVETVFEKAQRYQVAEISSDVAALRFLRSLHTISPDFQVVMNGMLATGNSVDFRESLQYFRNFMRNQSTTQKGRARQGAFDTRFQTLDQDGNSPPSVTSTTPPPSSATTAWSQARTRDGKPFDKCICGLKHLYKECFYLNEAVRPKWWKPRRSVQSKIDASLDANPERRDSINRALGRLKSGLQTDQTQHRTQSPQTQVAPSTVPANFMVASHASLSTSAIDQYQYELHDSFILDTGATGHVCNNRDRFIVYSKAPPTDFLIAGNSTVAISGWGTIELRTLCDGFPNGRAITVSNVAYVPSFHCSVISFRILRKKGLEWSSKYERLEYQDMIFCRTPEHFEQWTLEYNECTHKAVNSNELAVFKARKQGESVTTLKLDMLEAHEIFGHVNTQALKRLPEVSSGLQITGQNRDPSCEVCRLGDATRQISTIPTTPTEAPFYELCWDAIYQIEGVALETKVSHFYDPWLGFHFVYSMVTGSIEEIMWGFEYTLNYIETQYNLKVRIIKIDGEQTLLNSDRFADFQGRKGFQLNISAPNAHQQHGRAERSGGVLTNRATKLRLSAGLPEKMWRYIYEAAGYLLNRTPTYRLDWESPLYRLNSYLKLKDPKPPCHHLRPYGSKAYAFIHGRPKLNKLAKKAHVGYLVGYLSTNIWSIWVPSINRVIPMRDVTFDSTERYNADAEIEVTQEEAMALEVPQIEVDQALNDQPITHVFEPIGVGSAHEKSIDAPGDTVVVQNPQLRTPEPTPPPSDQADQLHTMFPQPGRLNQSTPQEQEQEQEQRVARRDIDGDVNERNIIEGKRARKRSQFAFNTLSTDQEAFYYSAFIVAMESHSLNRLSRLHRSQLPSPPRYWRDLNTHVHGDGFRAAARAEYSTLEQRGTWNAVKLDSIKGAQVLPVMWVFTYKFDEGGHLLKYKARLVARGDLHVNQREETYAATLAARVFRSLMAIAAHFDLDIHQLDAINAFINAELDEVVHIAYPDGFGNHGHVLHLKRALYGLPRSPLLWFKHLSNTVAKLGLKPVPECACLFSSNHLVVFFYVDDICILSHPRHRDKYEAFRAQLMNEYELKDLGELNWFLGIRVVRDRTQRKLWLCQDAYIAKIAAKFGLSHTHATTPMVVGELEPYTGQATEHEIRRYQQLVGSINYPSVITRPDTSYTSSKLSEHLQNPSPIHTNAAERCISYLNSTRTLALEYGSTPSSPPTFETGTDTQIPLNFAGFSDASYADNTTTRRSTQGTKTTLFGGTSDWQVMKQPVVSTSTTEAELRAASSLFGWLLWWQRFFDNIRLELDQQLTGYCDNLQTVRLLTKESPKLVTKLKHVDIHQHWLREQVESGAVDIRWISTSQQAADGLTKPLTAQKHANFIKQLNMVDIKPLIDVVEGRQ